jgi:hypothetical protein
VRFAPRTNAARAHAAGLLFAALAGLSGCAYSLVADGGVRPEPFEQIVARTVRARGIAPEGEVRTRVIRAAELPALLRSALAAEWTGAQMRSYQEGLTTLGLWPPDLDLADTFVGVYAEEVVGLYLPADRTLFLVDDVERPWSLRLLSSLTRRDLQREVILSHELVHFLQHQAFPGLMDPDPWWKTQGDAASAVQAALEGDALHYGFASLEIDPPAEGELRTAMQLENAARSQGALAEAPALLRLTLSFPYAYGYGLSLREGRALLAAPPASTEQVLHSHKRLEAFDAIDLAALRAALSADCAVDFEDTLGELGISVLLRDLDPVGPAAAWEGWDGDRWLAARCAGRRELVWITAWDSEADAAEFAEAYARVAPRVAERTGMATPPVAQLEGRDVVIATPGFAALAARPELAAQRREVADLAGLRAAFPPAAEEAASAGGQSDPPP